MECAKKYGSGELWTAAAAVWRWKANAVASPEQLQFEFEVTERIGSYLGRDPAQDFVNIGSVIAAGGGGGGGGVISPLDERRQHCANRVDLGVAGDPGA